MIYKTNISPVFSRIPANVIAAEPVNLKPLTKEGRELRWLDEMCRGGIPLPDDLRRGASLVEDR